MMSRILIFLLLTGFSATAQVRKHPIDQTCSECIAKANSPEPGAVRACEAAALRQWNTELARLLAADHRTNAKAEQAAWVNHRNEQLAKMRKSFGEAANTMAAADELRDAQINLARQRVDYLAKILAKSTVKTL